MPEDFMDIPTGASLTKTSRAREAVNIPPGITLATLRDGYPWRTHGGCQAFIEYSAIANQWEWEVTSGREDGAFAALTGAARYLHRALTDLLNAEARLLRDAFLSAERARYSFPEPRPQIDIEALRSTVAASASRRRLTMAETTRSALDALAAGHGMVAESVDSSVLERLWRGAGPVPEASDEPSARHDAAWRDEMGRAAIATFERTLLNGVTATFTDAVPPYDDIMDDEPF